MKSVEIIVGQSWKSDVRFIDSLRSRRPSESGLNLLDIRDIIDIVVDGTNITASIPEEAIFALVGSVLAALVTLESKEADKAIIEFHHEPWELAMVPDKGALFLSLYSVDRRQKVVARDLRVEARVFVDALCKVAEEMLNDLFRVSERFSKDLQVRQISQSLAHLKRGRLEFSPRQITAKKRDQAQHLATTSSSGGLTLGYRFDGADSALRQYFGEHVFDMHALLFGGVVEAEFGAQEFVLSREYPFLAIASLMDRARQLFNQLESYAHAPFSLTEEMAHLSLEVFGEGSRWRLRAFDVDRNNWQECTVAPAECLDALVSLGELFVRDVLRANAHLEVNQRFLDLQDEVEKLRLWHRDLCGNNLYHDRPEDYLRQLGHLSPQAAPKPQKADFPWPLSTVHALFARQSWSLEAERIDFSSIRLTDQGLFVTTREALLCLDPRRGSVTWRHEFATPVEHTEAVSFMGPHLVVATGSEELAILNPADGSLRARVQSDVAWQSLSAAAYYESESLVVLGSVDGELIGFDPESGQIRWRQNNGPGRSHSMIFEGPLICTQSSEGVVAALNPQSGETLWKVRTGGVPEAGLRLHQGRIYALNHDSLHQGSTLYSLYPFMGRSVWQVRLSGHVCGPPSFIDRWLVVPVERHGQIFLTGIDLESVDPTPDWQLELSSAGIDRPTEVLPVKLDGQWHGLVRTDRAELSCFRLSTGELRWRVAPTEATLLLYGNLPLFRVRDAVVNIAQSVELRALHTGELLHSFEAIEAPEFGFFLPPFGLLLGEKGPRAEDVDQLTAYHAEHFLAEVR